ncbi:hypothetical protein [Helicobacter pylori]|uniref:hypothetical protein n=1 Tax=Helicobacter pylori TaxID=210 RepID=UPI0015E7DDA2|nr:hypothetical protein [Helicobacter pylori]
MGFKRPFLALVVALGFKPVSCVGSFAWLFALVCALFFSACIACVISLSSLKLVTVSFFLSHILRLLSYLNALF